MTWRSRITTMSCVALAFASGPVVRAETTAAGNAAYVRVLETFVDADGRVDYGGLKADRADLDAYLRMLGEVRQAEYDAMGREERIAFWVNAYNAFTLVAVVDHYPIPASRVKSLVFPKNSIRHIPGVWDELKFTVAGDHLTLNQIEHEILRARFREPRVHMALVCASIGCPTLRQTPYTAARLDSQLDDQARRFLSLHRNFAIDRERGIVHISSIFDWFAGDFAGFADDVELQHEHGTEETPVLEFIARYLDGKDRDYLVKNKYHVAYLPYDWTLNEKESE